MSDAGLLVSSTGLADALGIVQDTLAVVLRQAFAIQRMQIQILAQIVAQGGVVQNIQTQETQNMASFHDLQQQVTKSDNVMDGAVQLFSIAQMLQDAKNQNQGDPAATSAAIDQVINDLNSRTESLAQALVKNTPVDPNPQAQPVPTTGQMNQPVPTGPAPQGTDTPIDPSIAGAATPQDNGGGSGTAPGSDAPADPAVAPPAGAARFSQR
jgi:hypothetical protein